VVSKGRICRIYIISRCCNLSVSILWYWTSILWSIDTCQNKESAGQYQITILQAQVYSSPRSGFFWSLPLTKFCSSIGSRAYVRQGRIVRKPNKANPGLKVNRIITFSSTQMLCFAAFCCIAII